MKKNVTLIFDIGKTNKKYFLFDEELNELESAYIQVPEITDDDGYPCDDLAAIKSWMLKTVNTFLADDRYNISFINFSAYGATLVHLNTSGEPCTPLYNYLKTFPEETEKLFISKHGNITEWSRETASPYLGMLNAGLQMFWLKHYKPQLFQNIHASIFLPQYLSYVLSGVLTTEYTSLGCHTGIWNFEKNKFHKWMYKENITSLFPAVVTTHTNYAVAGTNIKTGVGIHDSSAALIPYLKKNNEPFILLSTGTWSICSNAFNNEPLTTHELNFDCLCYLQPDGKQVKASRFFLGPMFTAWEKQVADFFKKPADYYHSVKFSDSLFEKSVSFKTPVFISKSNSEHSYFPNQSLKHLDWFDNYEEAYHHLINELVTIQALKVTAVVGNTKIKKMYVDGGFAKNEVFLHTLEKHLTDFIILPSNMASGSSLGAAMITDNNIKEQLKQLNNL